MIGVGTLGAGTTATVDTDGTVHQGPLRLRWYVRSGNDWLVPGRDAPARQSRPAPAPLVHTALRISHGDAIERVYAVGEGDGSAVVIEVENDSPEAIAVGFRIESSGSVDHDENAARVDGRVVLGSARRAGAVEPDYGLVFPVPHRTKVRVALAGAGVDVGALAETSAVVRAWDRMLDRGLRTELPEPLQSEVDAARADALLARASPEAFAALEAWGFDDDAVAMWGRLSNRQRRAARRASSAPARGVPGVLGEIRAALLDDRGARLDLLPGFRVAWLGQPVGARDIPLRRGLCSYALRWHGARPALLWDVPAGSVVRVPAIDAAWSSTDPVGETLLPEPPPALLALGAGAERPGTAVEAPDQFT